MVTEELILTDDEKYMLRLLHRQVRKVLGDKAYLTRSTFPTALMMCNTWNLTSQCMESNITPDNAVGALKGLLEKKLVREYKRDKLPAFLPLCYCCIEVTSMEDMPASGNYDA